MAASLNNVTTADAYTIPNTLYAPGTVRLLLQVNNASIYYKYRPEGPGRRPEATPYEPETFLVPGIYSFARPCSEIAVRSGAAGVSAQVTIEAR